jgi:hypothetical protein
LLRVIAMCLCPEESSPIRCISAYLLGLGKHIEKLMRTENASEREISFSAYTATLFLL